MASLTLFMTEHCALCETVLDMLFTVPAMQGITLNTIDIALDDALVEKYGERIPVLKVGDAELGAPIDAATLQIWLQNNCQ
jgi:hypothetical protein|tara:strand:- start:84 stop:326 length:243 start_codon:yes stop_codon:yes gene_type:complete